MLSGRCQKRVRTLLWFTAVPFQNARGGLVFSEREARDVSKCGDLSRADFIKIS